MFKRFFMFFAAGAMLAVAGCNGSSTTTSSTTTGGTTSTGNKVNGSAKAPSGQAKIKLAPRSLLKSKNGNVSALRRYYRHQLNARFQGATALVPLANAEVSLVDIDTKAVVATTKCNANGEFTLDNLPTGLDHLVIIIVKKNTATDITIVKIGMEKYSTGSVDLKAADPSTTLAAESYATQIDKAVAAGKSADEVDLDAFEEKYEGMQANTLFALYEEQDQTYDSKAGDEDFYLDDLSVPDPELEALCDAVQEAEDKEEELLASFGVTALALDTLDASIESAANTLDTCLASVSGSEPSSDYEDELAAILVSLGVTDATGDAIEADLAEADADLDAVLGNAASTTAEINAAFERYFADYELIEAGVDITAAIDAELDTLQDNIEAACTDDGTGNCQFTEAFEDADEALHTKVIRLIVDVAAGIKGTTVSDAQFDFLDELFEEGFVDENGNGQADPDEPQVDEAAVQADIDSTCGAFPTEPTPPSDTATQEEWDAFFIQLDAYFDKVDAFYDCEDDIVTDAVIAEALAEEPTLYAGVDVAGIVDLEGDLEDAADQAGNNVGDDWSTYYASFDASIEACYVTYDESVSTAYVAVGLSLQQLSDLFTQVAAAFDTAIAEAEAAGVSIPDTFEDEVSGVYDDLAAKVKAKTASAGK